MNDPESIFAWEDLPHCESPPNKVSECVSKIELWVLDETKVIDLRLKGRTVVTRMNNQCFSQLFLFSLLNFEIGPLRKHCKDYAN